MVGKRVFDEDGQLDRHHVVPRSRLRNDETVRMNVPFHLAWHVMFMNMTPSEACMIVEIVMLPKSRTKRTNAWGWKEFCALRRRIMHATDKRASRNRKVFREIYHPRNDAATILLDRHSEGFAKFWAMIFDDLQTVGQVCEFIRAIMVPGTEWPAERIRELRQEIAARVVLKGARIREVVA